MFGLGSSSQLGIGIAIKLNNQFSGEAAKVNQQLLAMRKNANSAVSGAMRDYRNQAASIALAAGAASAGMFRMAEAGAKYGHAINQIFIVGGKEMVKSRAQLDKYAQSMSKMFSLAPEEVASAMFENAKAGVRDNMEEVTKYQIAVATATDEAIGGEEGVANMLLGIAKAMDIPTNHFKDVANAITAVANATLSSVHDLGESMKYGAFTAHQFNLPLTTTLAIFGKLSQVGIRGSMAGTGVNNMLTQMAKGLGPFQTKSQLAAWKMMGLDPKQISAMANSGNIAGVLKAVSDATQNMTPIQKGSIIPKAFNIRGTRAVEGLFDSKNNSESIGSILRAAEAGVKNDIALKQSKAMMNDMYSDFKFLTNAFHRFRISFAKAAEPTLRVLLQVGTKVMGFISSIVDSPIGKVLAGIVAVVAPVIGVMFAFRAALFTATIALRGIAGTASIGGFRGLLGAGLNMVGLARFGNKGGNIMKNSAGRYFWPAGSMSATGEKIGGRLVGKAALAEMGLAAGGATAAVEGIGILGTISGILGTALPILGGILAAVEVLKALGIIGEERQKKNNDPLIAEYYKNLDAAYYGRTNSNRYYLTGGNKMPDPSHNPNNLNQQIVINVDGKTQMEKVLQQKMDDTLNSAMNFNIKQ